MATQAAPPTAPSAMASSSSSPAPAPVPIPQDTLTPPAPGVGASAALHSLPSSNSPTPVFRPPLFEQRQGFILSTLRKHRVREVLEVGCERGRLLQYLAQPEFQIDTFPFHRYPARLERRLPREHWTRDLSGLVLERLEGLDLDGENLKAAVSKLESARSSEASRNEAPEPTPSQGEDGEETEEVVVPVISKGFAPLRFVTMRAAILQGGLEIYNERFRGIDAIVASEVVEHLHEPVLDAFAPILLGRYRPRLLLITTPNYAFNTHFPRTPAQPGIEDPTGRTERKFRHPDHKFEWTTHEFKDWCERAAERFGYEVEIGGLGMLNIERRRGAPRPVDSDGEEEEDSAEQVAEIEALMKKVDESNRFASQTAVFRRLGKAPPGTATTSVSMDSRSRSRSTVRGIALSSAAAAGTTEAHHALDTDGPSESDDFRGAPPQRGRDRSVEAFRRPSVVSGSESEVGPMQTFTVGSLHLSGSTAAAFPGRLPSAAAAAAAAGAATPGSTGTSSAGGGTSTPDSTRPSLQHSRRVSRSRKPENLPWLSNTGTETGAAVSAIDSAGNSNGAMTTASPITASAGAGTGADSTLFTSTGGLDGVSLTPTPTISMVQHKMLWEAEFPAVVPPPSAPTRTPPTGTDANPSTTTTSEDSAPAPATGATTQRVPPSSLVGSAAALRRVQPKIAEAVIEVLSHEAELVRVPAIVLSGTPSSNEKEIPTIVEARLPLWSAFRDDMVRRNVEGSVTRLLAGLGLLPRTGESAAGASSSSVAAGRARSSSFQRVVGRTNGAEHDGVGEVGSAGLVGSAEGQERGNGPAPETAASASGKTNASSGATAVLYRPLRDASTVMATDGVMWELRLLSRPSTRSRNDDGEEGAGGALPPRRAVSGNEAREGLVDGEDDGNEEDDEDDSEEEEEEDGEEGREDGLFGSEGVGSAAPADAGTTDAPMPAAAPRRTRVPNRKKQTPRGSSARSNNDLYLIYYGPEPSVWLSGIESEEAEIEAEEAERQRVRDEKRVEVEKRGAAIEALGGWGHPSMAGKSLEETDKMIEEVRARSGVDADVDAGLVSGQTSASGVGATEEKLTGWE
ncbi:hypothetical protein A4X13_0g2050 [Tilletia indica]|uniref:Small RNA 2'-O-methyltransferase n=1 Tax=Tilletia indica TaxID=43049 RepID=A0A177TT93_9BASI|nr:hypothetical protein A4X13_0g2050 [Tilletia indica]